MQSAIRAASSGPCIVLLPSADEWFSVVSPSVTHVVCCPSLRFPPPKSHSLFSCKQPWTPSPVLLQSCCSPQSIPTTSRPVTVPRGCSDSRRLSGTRSNAATTVNNSRFTVCLQSLHPAASSTSNSCSPPFSCLPKCSTPVNTRSPWKLLRQSRVKWRGNWVQRKPDNWRNTTSHSRGSSEYSSETNSVSLWLFFFFNLCHVSFLLQTGSSATVASRSSWCLWTSRTQRTTMKWSRVRSVSLKWWRKLTSPNDCIWVGRRRWIAGRSTFILTSSWAT